MGAQDARLRAGHRLNSQIYDTPSERSPGSRAARPRDAATLILIRRDRGRAELLMGQRHAGHRFMPNKFVFPGGGLDRADYRVAAAGELRREVARLVEIGAGASKARALAIAAIRETLEETGLKLGRPAAPAPSSGAWTPFAEDGLAPSLDVLDYVARAITPPYRARRFDARFFMADAHHIHHIDLDRLAGSGELLKLNWVTTDEAMSLDPPNITKLVIREVAARLAAPETKRPVPFTRFVRGRAVVEDVV